MLYRVTYADGSEELIETCNIAAAREEARALYDEPVKKVVVEDTDEDDDEGDDDEDGEDDGEDADDEE